MTFANYAEQLGKALGLELDASDGVVGLEVDGLQVLVHDAGEFVLMRAEIGPSGGAGGSPAEAQSGSLRPDLLRLALEANWLYRGTGGGSLALDPEPGALWLQKYDWLERLDASAAVETLARFAETAAHWREIAGGVRLSRPDDAANAADATSASLPLNRPDFMAV